MAVLSLIWRRALNLWVDQGGLGTVEYALLLTVIVLAVGSSFTDLGCKVNRYANRGARALQ